MAGHIVLLKSYTKEFFNNKCMPSAVSLQCFAHLEEDVGKALPYLNATLGGHSYTRNPPSVTFKIQGKLITIHANKIAINALRDAKEATKILEWLKREINSAWENRNEIKPSYDALPIPKVIDILRFLPKTNCGDCGQKTCLVFATMVVEGGKGHQDCPQLDDVDREKLSDYIDQFAC